MQNKIGNFYRINCNSTVFAKTENTDNLDKISFASLPPIATLAFTRILVNVVTFPKSQRLKGCYGIIIIKNNFIPVFHLWGWT